MKSHTTIIGLAIFLLGLLVGGYIFTDVQPRSVISLNHCENTCWRPKDLLGLLASIGFQKLGLAFPGAIFESDKIVVVNYPTPRTSFHEVIFPKKDIKDISQISQDDWPYLLEIFNYIAKMVKEKELRYYKVVTNGPDFQNMTYLHFHLIGEIGTKVKN